MRIFGRRPPAPLVEIGEGFWVTEAPALQQGIRSALTAVETARQTAPAELSVERGRDERLVVLWRNFIVGFVPEAHLPPLREQLADHSRVTIRGSAHLHGDEWRIWAGPTWPAVQGPPAYPQPTITPAPPAIFGVQLGNLGTRTD